MIRKAKRAKEEKDKKDNTNTVFISSKAIFGGVSIKWVPQRK